MIRSSNFQDIDRIIRIWTEASVLAHPFVPALYWVSNQENMRNLYLPQSLTYVFEQESMIYGFISMIDNYLAALFVIPEAQGKGIGNALMEFAKASRTEITLKVYSKNIPSVVFYEKQGFQFIKEVIDKDTCEREWIMKWRR